MKSGIHFIHSRHTAAACSSTHSPTGMMSRLFSSSGINSTGEISRPSGMR